MTDTELILRLLVTIVDLVDHGDVTPAGRELVSEARDRILELQSDAG
jgi:hypothetical protein